MPTYQYVCTVCADRLEAQQSFSDDPLTACPACEGRLRKVFGAVGVVFKGSGFYRNDSRPAERTSSSDGDDTKPAAAKESGAESSKPTDGAARNRDKAAAKPEPKASATKDSAA